MLTGNVAERFDDTLFPSKSFGPDIMQEKCDQSYNEASETLTEIRGKLLKLNVWETFERNFGHFDFELVNHKRVAAPVDLFDLKGKSFI